MSPAVGRGAGRGGRWSGLARRSLLATTALMLTVVLTVAVLLPREGRAPTSSAAAVLPAANRAVRIDTATYQAVAAVTVGADPAAVVGGGGLVWVTNRRRASVTVIDPASNQVQRTMPAAGSGPVGQGGPGLAFASGNLWIAAQRQVVRIEPDGDPAAAIIPVDASPSAIAAAPANADAVWVAARTLSGGGLLACIDAGSNRVVQTVALRHAPTGLAITSDGRSIWVPSARDKAILRVDTRAGAVTPIQLPHAPDQATFGDGAVWVTSSRDDAVLRIDPVSSKVRTIRVGNGPRGIASAPIGCGWPTARMARSPRSTPRPTRSASCAWDSGRSPWRSTSARSGSR